MLNRYITFYKPATQFVVFCGLVSFSMLLGGFLLSFLQQKYTGYTQVELSALKVIPDAIILNLKLLEYLAIIIIVLLPALLFAYLAYPKPAKYLGMNLGIKPHHWLWAISLLLVALPFSSLLEKWSDIILHYFKLNDQEDSYTVLANAFLKADNVKELWLNILGISMLPAIVEEIFFRGCLQQILLSWMRKTPFIAMLITAVLFSLFHGQLSGFIPRLFLGLLLGLSFYYTGSIWVSILLHALNNFVTVYLMYLFHTHAITLNVSNMPEMNTWFGLASGFATLLLLFFFWQDRKKYVCVEVERDHLNQTIF